MVDRYLISNNYEEQFKRLSVTKQLKSIKICNDIANEDEEYVVAADISTKLVDGFIENVCAIVKMCYVGDIIAVASTSTF